MLTYNDFQKASDREAFLLRAIEEYCSSERYGRALEADAYYAGDNPGLLGFRTDVTLGNRRIDLTAAIRTPGGIFKRLIIQLVQTVWSYGVQLDSPELKEKLGTNFDFCAKCISKKAALHGVCYGFWNYDHIEMFTALEYFPLKDERSSRDVAGIRFWRISEDKPMYVQIFEADGWTEYKQDKPSGPLEQIAEKQSYKRIVRQDAISTEIIGGENYGVLPVIPLYANENQESELTRPIKSKIDLSDFILSGFGDSIMRTKVIYWVLQGFSGQTEDLQGILKEVEKLGIIAPGDDSTAAAHTVDLPFGAVKYALEYLRKEIYSDFMGMDVSEITGSSLTNVAIQTNQYNLSLKASDFEWNVFQFVQKVLALQGIVTENIRFKKKSISNELETMQTIALCRADLDTRTALEKNPLMDTDEVEITLARRAAEEKALD